MQIAQDLDPAQGPLPPSHLSLPHVEDRLSCAQSGLADQPVPGRRIPVWGSPSTFLVFSIHLRSTRGRATRPI